MFYDHEHPANRPANAPESFNPLAAAARLSPEQIERSMQRGRQLRSEAFQRALSAMVRGAMNVAKRALAANRQWREVRRTERALRGLSPQLLRDIGIDGHQIPAIARGLDGGRSSAEHARAAVHAIRPAPAGVADASAECKLCRAA